jgi:hypothetical protein
LQRLVGKLKSVFKRESAQGDSATEAGTPPRALNTTATEKAAEAEAAADSTEPTAEAKSAAETESAGEAKSAGKAKSAAETESAG